MLEDKELARDLMHDRQYLLSQQSVVNLNPRIDEYYRNRNRNRNHTESMLPPTQDRRPSTMSKMIVVIGRQSKTEMSLVCV